MISPMVPFRPFFRADTYRVLAFLAASVPIGAVALAALIAGWTAVPLVAITPLVVPALVGFRVAVGLLARADADLARSLLGVDVRPSISSGGRGFWGRGKAVIGDGAFWRQQAYLALRMTFGFAFAVGELSLLAWALGAVSYPIWYRWSDADFGSWHANTLPRALLFVPAGIVALALAGYLARPLGSLSMWLLRALLDWRPGAEPTPEQVRQSRRRALRIHAGLAGGFGLIEVVIWAAAGRGYFWPEWVLLPLALALAIHGWVELLEERPGLRDRLLGRRYAIHLGVVVALVAFLTLVWAVTSRGYFWPGWVALGLAIPLGIHALVARSPTRSRLERRLEVVETSRAAAVDAQATELRRIERDLHDGAQARLVALGMSLGLAEQKFATDPEGAQKLLAEARAGVGEALRELRDLARGIYPPVLSDRGLAAALASLADRSPLPVALDVSLDERPEPNIETAAYFVAAEALANAGKHAGATRVDIGVSRRGDTLVVEVTDDGRGGADSEGSGLVGLRRRVEALDGTLTVLSPAGGPTTVRAELPCAS